MATARQTVNNLNKVSAMVDSAKFSGTISEDEHRELKTRTKEAAMDLLFKMMAQYCSK